MDMATPAIGVPLSPIPTDPSYFIPSDGITHSGTQEDVDIGPGTYPFSIIAVP